MRRNFCKFLMVLACGFVGPGTVLAEESAGFSLLFGAPFLGASEEELGGAMGAGITTRCGVLPSGRPGHFVLMTAARQDASSQAWTVSMTLGRAADQQAMPTVAASVIEFLPVDATAQQRKRLMLTALTALGKQLCTVALEQKSQPSPAQGS